MYRLLYLITFCLSVVFARPFISAEVVEKSSASVVEKIYSPTECYIVIKELGEGAFGKVYAVENERGEQFAIKCYKTWNGNKRFNLLADAEREFQRGQLLDHPNIVKAFDLFTSSSPSHEITTNLVLELVEGQTLSKTKRGMLSKEETLNAVMQFIHALRYALSFDLMHIDLHGGNVMLDKNTNFKVIDLASFYSIEELLKFATEPKQKTTEYSQSELQAKALAVREDHEGIRTEKLRKFFNQNPQLLEQLEQIHEKNEQLMSKQATDAERVSNHKNSNHPSLSPLHSYYFNSVTEICINLIMKTDLNRQEKINLCSEVKKLAWNYQEDLEDAEKASLDGYLDQLVQMLQSY